MESIPQPHSRIRAYIRALRLERWPRSLAILPGWVLAVWTRSVPIDGTTLALFFVAYLATLAVSIFNYAVNEVLDAPFDAHHPRKKYRPVAQGRVSKRAVLATGVGFLLVGLGIGNLFGTIGLVALVSLALAGLAYNVPPLRTKDIPFLDALVESANNPIRFMIGWAAVAPAGVWPLAWWLTAWWSFGAFLMYLKRLMEKEGLTEAEARAYRRSLAACSRRALMLATLVALAMTLAFLVAAALALNRMRLLAVVPLALGYGLWMFWRALHRLDPASDVEAFFRDPVFLVWTMILAAAFLWAVG